MCLMVWRFLERWRVGRARGMVERLEDRVLLAANVIVAPAAYEFRDMGFDGFLGKPLDNARFPDQLARILRGEPVWERV